MNHRFRYLILILLALLNTGLVTYFSDSLDDWFFDEAIWYQALFVFFAALTPLALSTQRSAYQSIILGFVLYIVFAAAYAFVPGEIGLITVAGLNVLLLLIAIAGLVLTPPQWLWWSKAEVCAFGIAIASLALWAGLGLFAVHVVGLGM